MTSTDAMMEISNGYLDDLIPEELSEKWKERSRHRLQDPSNSYQRLLLLQAFINFGSHVQIKRLLEKWGYIEILNHSWGDENNGGTVLMEAAWLGRDDIVTLLCDFGSNVDLASPRGWTALHCAVYANQIRIVKILLEMNANAELRDATGITPLELARAQGYHPIARVLKSRIQRDRRGRPSFFSIGGNSK